MRILGPSTLLLAAALAGCGGDATGPGTSSNNGSTGTPRGLTAGDAAAIGRAFLAPGVNVATAGAAGKTPTASRVPGTAPLYARGAFETGEVPFGFTVPCQPTGTFNVEGTIGAAWDPVTQLAGVHARVTLRPNACPVQSDGATVTVTGNPAVDLTLSAVGDATGVKGVLLTEKGEFTWRKSDGSSGSCTLQVIGAAIAGTPNYRVTGDVCGTSIDVTGPI